MSPYRILLSHLLYLGGSILFSASPNELSDPLNLNPPSYSTLDSSVCHPAAWRWESSKAQLLYRHCADSSWSCLKPPEPLEPPAAFFDCGHYLLVIANRERSRLSRCFTQAQASWDLWIFDGSHWLHLPCAFPGQVDQWVNAWCHGRLLLVDLVFQQQAWRFWIELPQGRITRLPLFEEKIQWMGVAPRMGQGSWRYSYLLTLDGRVVKWDLLRAQQRSYQPKSPIQRITIEGYGGQEDGLKLHLEMASGSLELSGIDLNPLRSAPVPHEEASTLLNVSPMPLPTGHDRR